MAQNHSRDYYRKVRKLHIKRKKNIDNIKIQRMWGGTPYYSCDGKYSKNKVHCSCDMCSLKSTRDYLSRHDAIQKYNALEQYHEYGVRLGGRGKILRTFNTGFTI